MTCGEGLRRPHATTGASGEDSGKLRAAIIGGSLGGLFVGLALREAGCDVEVFERSPHELQGRGAGIVAQPELLHFLEKCEISSREEVGVPSRTRRYLRRDGSVAHEEEATS